MFRYGLLWSFLLALVLVGVLAGGGFALYRFGYVQGYQVGALPAASGSGTSTAPIAPPFAYGYPYPGFGFWPFFPPFGFFACFAGFFLLFFVFGGLFRFGAHRRWMHEGWKGEGWKHGPWSPEAREWWEKQRAEHDKTEGSPTPPPESQT